jgi:hypothetical protein
MNDLVAIGMITQWRKLKMLVLDSVSSPITKRVYSMRRTNSARAPRMTIHRAVSEKQQVERSTIMDKIALAGIGRVDGGASF